jgi:hypothetical protein
MLKIGILPLPAVMQPSSMKNTYLNGATLVFDLDGTLIDTAPGPGWNAQSYPG